MRNFVYSKVQGKGKRMKNQNKVLDNILQNKQIETLFQPIVSLGCGTILGYEALNRAVSKDDFNDPKQMFAAAKEQNILWDLELLCQTNALETAHFHLLPPHNKKLFLNIEPEVVKDSNFQKYFSKNLLNECNIPKENIIFELSEEAIYEDMDSFKEAAAHYKQHNFLLAIDDAGIGYSGLSLVEDVKPNYLKVAMRLVRDIDKDRIKRGLVKAMVEFAKASNVLLIAEGVETYEELNTLTKLGVNFAQGYLIQKPSPEIKNISNDVKEMIERVNLTINKTVTQNIYHSTISELCENTDTIYPNMLISEAYELLRNYAEYGGFCVTDNGIPVGILMKDKLTKILSGRYGFTLHQNKTVDSIMDSDFLMVDSSTPINIVSNLAMERPQDKIYDFIVVTDENKYIGTVSIKCILQKAMEIEISSARSLSPLTGLPGNNHIEAKLKEMLKDYRDYSVAYIDIDHFKAFNDVYGFENGDRIIQLLANNLKEAFNEEDFIGHIGGDDFIVISKRHLLEYKIEDLIREFESDALTYYRETDIENGYIISESRSGEERRYPLTTITVAHITNEAYNFKTTNEITEALTGLKSRLRQKRVLSETPWS